ncbi:unnamed protein product, partial [Brachionus calyciflorus]
YAHNEIKEFIDIFHEDFKIDQSETTYKLEQLFKMYCVEIDLIQLKRLIMIYLILINDLNDPFKINIQNVLFKTLQTLWKEDEKFYSQLIKLFEARLFVNIFTKTLLFEVKIRFGLFLINFSKLSISNSRLFCARMFLCSLYKEEEEFRKKADLIFVECDFYKIKPDEINSLLENFDNLSNDEYMNSLKAQKRPLDSSPNSLDQSPKRFKTKEITTQDNLNKTDVNNNQLLDNNHLLSDIMPTINLNNLSFNAEFLNDFDHSICERLKEPLREPEVIVISSDDEHDETLSTIIKKIEPLCNCITLYEQKIETFPLSVLCKFPNLKSVTINYCNLNHLDTKDLNCLNNLEILNLRSNCLTQIDSGLFEKIPKLSQLDLRNNKIQNLSENIFKSCKKLKILNLSNNMLSNLDASLFEFSTSLEEIDCSKNFIEKLDANLFKNLINLKKINFCKNKIIALGEGIFDSNRLLTEILISNNSIVDLPKGLFKNLDFLNIINLSNNRIEILDADLFEHNIQLNQIQISYNRIQNLDSNIFKNLIELYLVHCTNNQIDYLPKELFRSCLKLKRIFFLKNKIKNLDMNLFNNLVELEEIDFSKNVSTCCLDVDFLKFIAPNLKFVRY